MNRLGGFAAIALKMRAAARPARSRPVHQVFTRTPAARLKRFAGQERFDINTDTPPETGPSNPSSEGKSPLGVSLADGHADRSQ
jgi:hypothetical protein